MSISCLFQRQWDSSSRVNATFFALDLLNSLDYFSSQGELFWCWIAFSTFTYSSRMFYLAFCIDLSCSQFKTNITNKTLQFTQRLRVQWCSCGQGKGGANPKPPCGFCVATKGLYPKQRSPKRLFKLELYIAVHVTVPPTSWFHVHVKWKRQFCSDRIPPAVSSDIYVQKMHFCWDLDYI